MQFNKHITNNEFLNKFDITDKIENINRIAHNTFEYTINGIKKVMYTNTDIIIFHKKNIIELNTGGFYTKKTKDRLNRYLQYGCIYTDKGIWYYSQYGNDTPIRFFDGIKINLNTGDVINKSKAQKQSKIDNFNKKLLKQINTYCDKIKNIKKLPKDSSGDCLYCQSNLPDTYHLLLHLKEKYIMKSLIMNALSENNHTSFIYENDMKNTIIRDVKKYFKKHLMKHLSIKGN